MGSWAERAAKNEALFREVNERIREAAEAMDTQGILALCECADPGCTETLRITLTEYRHVRARSDRFAVIAGHEDPAIERVTERRGGYIIVEKTGAAGELARKLDQSPDHP